MSERLSFDLIWNWICMGLYWGELGWWICRGDWETPVSGFILELDLYWICSDDDS